MVRSVEDPVLFSWVVLDSPYFVFEALACASGFDVLFFAFLIVLCFEDFDFEDLLGGVDGVGDFAVRFNLVVEAIGCTVASTLTAAFLVVERVTRLFGSGASEA